MVCLIEHVPEYKWILEPLGFYEYTQLSLRQTSLGRHQVSALERCPSYRESNKGTKERHGPTLGARFLEVSVNRESTVLYVHQSGRSYSGYKYLTKPFSLILIPGQLNAF